MKIFKRLLVGENVATKVNRDKYNVMNNWTTMTY